MLHAIIRFLAAVRGPARNRRPAPPRDLSRLSDHHLRDLGLTRERAIAPARHLLPM